MADLRVTTTSGVDTVLKEAVVAAFRADVLIHKAVKPPNHRTTQTFGRAPMGDAAVSAILVR